MANQDIPNNLIEVIRYFSDVDVCIEFVASFEQDNELLPLVVEIENCVFTEAGQYAFEVYFSARGGHASSEGRSPGISSSSSGSRQEQ